MSGSRTERSWHGGDELLDFYDAKGVVEALLGHLGIKADFAASKEEAFHPARQAAVVIAGSDLGFIGELHPRVIEAFEITGTAALFEIDLMRLLPFTLGHSLFQPVARFPAVARDIALVVSEAVTHNSVQEIIGGFPLVTRITLFDVYSGKQVPAGKKSLAYRLIFQSPSHTLTDDEVDKVQRQILDRLSRELGATLRG
jgi:phenylalanyl-tRNA synthetase beta chain